MNCPVRPIACILCLLLCGSRLHAQTLPVPPPDPQAQAHRDTAKALAAKYDYAGAIQEYQQAYLLDKTANLEDATLDLNKIGGCYLSISQYPKALNFYQQELALEQQIGDKAGEATTLNNIGLVYSNIGQPQKALDFYQQALPLRRQVGDKAGEATTLNNIMFAWKLLRQPGVAVFYGKQAVNVYQSIRANISTLDEQSQKTYLTANAGTYRTLADLLIGEGRLPEAQQVLGLLKEQEFFDFVRRSDAEAGTRGQADLTRLEGDQDKRMQALFDGLTTLGVQREAVLARKPLLDADQKQADDLDKQIATANAAFETFLKGLPAVFAQTTADKITTLRDTEGLQTTLTVLGHHSVALYTLVGPDKLRLLLVTPQVQIAREYPIKAADLNRMVADFRAALEDPHRDPRPLGKKLYDMMIGPVDKDLTGAGAQTILWSLDGTLRYVPVAALYDGKHYLVEQYLNTVFTPASMTHLADVPKPTKDWSALGMGVSLKVPGFNALPGAADELNGIIQVGKNGILPGTALLDAAFTQVTMQHALRRGYSVVHIASHFAFRPGNETDSFLLLGDGAHLSLADMKTMPGIFQGVDLLALSACDTATGGGADDGPGSGGKTEKDAADGSEVESFGVLAQRKGAEAVLASLWPVSDASTPLLMEDFYRRHQAASGVTKAEALQQAQRDLLHGTGAAAGLKSRGTAPANFPRGEQALPFTPDPKAPCAHPYYWAPFILIGNWK